MAEETEAIAPPRNYPRSDQQFQYPIPNINRNRQKSSKCFVHILVCFVIFCIALLIFASVVHRVKSPRLELTSVAVKNLRQATSPAPSLNATLTAEVRVSNKNFGPFKFENGSVAVFCEDVTIGISKLRKGVAKARKTEKVTVSVEVKTNGLLGQNQNFSRDLDLGVLRLRSHAKVTGRVHVLKIFDKERSSEVICDFSVNTTSKSVQDLECF
ncbi:hypothetical protein NMG60_11027032 [Bertholletia excelsa]